MKKKSVEVYSDEPMNKVLTKCAGVDGTCLKTCGPAWKKKYCDPQQRGGMCYDARKVGICSRFWPQGQYFKDRELAKLLKKSVAHLTNDNRYKDAKKFAQVAYKKCRKIVIIVKEV